MATKKQEVKVRDLKPSKDAKGGVARQNLSGATHQGAIHQGAIHQGATHQGATRQQGATRGHQ